MSDYRVRETERKPNPWIPLFGFICLVVFGGFSWVIAPQVRPLVENFGFQFPAEWPVWAGNALVAFVIFVILFAIVMMLVAFLAGPTGDARDVRTSAKKMRQQLDQRKRRRY